MAASQSASKRSSEIFTFSAPWLNLSTMIGKTVWRVIPRRKMTEHAFWLELERLGCFSAGGKVERAFYGFT